MTDTDLAVLVTRLLALPGEIEFREVKTAGTSFGLDEPGKYFSALSNERDF